MLGLYMKILECNCAFCVTFPIVWGSVHTYSVNVSVMYILHYFKGVFHNFVKRVEYLFSSRVSCVRLSTEIWFGPDNFVKRDKHACLSLRTSCSCLLELNHLKSSIWWTLQKQFKQQNQEPARPTEPSSKSASLDSSQVNANPSDVLEVAPNDQIQHDGEKRASVHNRIRMPVTYDDDLLGGEDFKDKSARLEWNEAVAAVLGTVRRPFFFAFATHSFISFVMQNGSFFVDWFYG